MKNKELKDLDDSSLWIMMTKGNRSALELLYSKHYDSLYYYGRRYSQDVTLIEDCIQDIFIGIFNNNQLKPVQYVQAYLLRSLKNLLLKHLSILPNYYLEEITFDISIEDSRLTGAFQKDDEALQISKDLIKAYEKLTDKQKNAIYLRYIKDMSYHEIAEALNINVQSAQNVVARTLIKLKNMMPLLF